MSGNTSTLMPFPENHWVVSFMVYAFHPTAFLRFRVFVLVTRISRNWQTGHLFTLRNTKESDRNSGTPELSCFMATYKIGDAKDLQFHLLSVEKQRVPG